LAANLPPVKHFHIVFTIPQCLHKLFYLNQGEAYDLLFKAAGQALMKCAANPQLMGAQAGAVCVLHTWGQTLVYHPHIHMIVPSGGLSEDEMEWIPSHKKFFLPVKILSNVFRGLLCRFLEQAVSTKAIKMPDDISGFKLVKSQCYAINWVVYCQKPFVVRKHYSVPWELYPRVVFPTTESSFENGKVTFMYKDYKTGKPRRSISLDADVFIRVLCNMFFLAGSTKSGTLAFLPMQHSNELALCIHLIARRHASQFGKDLRPWKYGKRLLARISSGVLNATMEDDFNAFLKIVWEQDNLTHKAFTGISNLKKGRVNPAWDWYA
jgi:hypothetical protein